MIDNESGLGANDYDMGILNWFDTSTAEQREMANNLRSEAQKFSLVCLRELAQKYPEIANLDLTKTTGRCVYFSTIAYVMSASLTIKTSFPEEDHRKMQIKI